MAIVWACRLDVQEYRAAGRKVVVPRPDCPRCGTAMTFWSGYRRACPSGLVVTAIWVKRCYCARCDRAVKMGTRRSRPAEDVVSPNAAAYDVGIAGLDLVAVLECRQATGSPGHFEDFVCALNALDPEAFAELTTSP